MRLCSFTARSEGQSGCSPEGKVGKMEGSCLGLWHVMENRLRSNRRAGPVRQLHTVEEHAASIPK